LPPDPSFTLPRFDPGRDRDAWSTLRGYVYQVDVTLDRWLDLDPGEILELESGEDVDLLGRAATAEGTECEWLLEQIKHLEKTVSLRSAPVGTFLANAHAHRRENPLRRLHFRFTTTATPATERQTTIRGGVPGITVWEQIRTGAWPQAELGRALLAIRELLAAPRAPDGLPVPIWDSYQEFVRNEDPTEIAAFIGACEWSTARSAGRGGSSSMYSEWGPELCTRQSTSFDPSAGSRSGALLTVPHEPLRRQGDCSDAEEPVHGRADHCGSPGARGRGRSGRVASQTQHLAGLGNLCTGARDAVLTA
jgi:hypothetical protein